MKFAIREKLSGKDIKQLRKKLNLTQNEFASFCCVSNKTIERWEKSEQVYGTINTIYEILNNNNNLIEELKIPAFASNFTVRLKYYENATLCTLIDVDEINRIIKIKNFTKDIHKRAFGTNNIPNYDDYIEFLKSRCFPEERDKLKLMLRELDLPFYDPFMIIEKTQGRMAEDNFWIKIEYGGINNDWLIWSRNIPR